MSKQPGADAAITAGSPLPAKASTSAFFFVRKFPPRACRSCRWPLASPPPMPFAPSPASASISAGPTISSSARAKPAASSSRQISKSEGLLHAVAVVGIGINVHQRAFPPDLATPATSLDLEANRRISAAKPSSSPC